MKRIFAALFVLAMSLCIIQPAHAEREWTGMQTIVSVEKSDSLRANIGFSTTCALYSSPRDEQTMWFAYAGPKFQHGGYVWAQPLIGLTHGWVKDEVDVIGAFWAGFSQGSLSISTDVEAIGDKLDYYGYHDLNVRLNQPFEIGWHIEEVRDVGQHGPHVHIYSGATKFTVEYYTGNGTQAFRLKTKFNL